MNQIKDKQSQDFIDIEVLFLSVLEKKKKVGDREFCYIPLIEHHILSLYMSEDTKFCLFKTANHPIMIYKIEDVLSHQIMERRTVRMKLSGEEVEECEHLYLVLHLSSEQEEVKYDLLTKKVEITSSKYQEISTLARQFDLVLKQIIPS